MQIYSTLKTEYGALNDYNSELLKEISFDNSLSGIINNVLEDTESNEIVKNSADIIAKLAEEWQTLDSSDVPPKRKVNGTGKRSSITVPYGWNPNDIASLNQHTSEGVSAEYLNKLSDIMRRIPDLAAGQGAAGDPFDDGSFLDQPALRKDLLLVPELALSFGKGRKTNISTEQTHPHDTVFSFALYKDDGGAKAHLPRQCVEVLGRDSLAQLMQAVHCAHNIDTGATETAAAFDEVITMSPVPRTAPDREPGNADGVLFVEGGLYCLPCRPASEGADCCTCPAPLQGHISLPPNSTGSTSSSSGGGTGLLTALRLRDWLQQYLLASATRTSTARIAPAARSSRRTAAVGAGVAHGQGQGQGASSMDYLDSELVIMEATGSNSNAAANKRRRVGSVAATAEPSSGGNKQKPRQSAGASAGVSKRTAKSKNAPVTADITATTPATAATADAPTATATTATGASHRHPLSQLCPGAPQVLCAKAMRCDSVQWQLGVPYLYTHAAGCEHVLYLTNIIVPQCGNIVHTPPWEEGNSSHPIAIRPTSPNTTDAGAIASEPETGLTVALGRFPRESYRARAKQRRCRVCDLRPAQYVLYGDRLADCSPCLYCEHCYHMLHYTAEGALLYDDFHVFPYTHDA